MKHLNFVLEQLGTQTPGGIGRYSRELFVAMSKCIPDEWDFHGQLPHRLSQEKISLPRDSEELTFNRQSTVPTRLISRMWAKGLNIDSPSGALHAPSLLAPMRKTSKKGSTVVTIHDTVPWTYPETLTKHGVAWHTKMLHRAYKYADAIVTPSIAVKEELNALFNFGDRIFVIPGAPSPCPEPTTSPGLVDRLPPHYFLIVGTLEPRKGILNAIMAASISQTLPLVHIGPLGWGKVDVSKFLQENHIPMETFLSLGFVPEDQLPEIYRRATALVMPSQNEGFGLPLIEAMSQGTPAITSNVPALIEVAGGSSLVANIEQPEFILQIAKHMTNIQSDSNLRKSLSVAAIQRSNSFSWAKSAQLAWELHNSLTA